MVKNFKAVVNCQDLKMSNFADFAENVIQSYPQGKHEGQKRIFVTSSQIRPLLSKIIKLVNTNKKKTGDLDSEDLGYLQYLKTSLIYASARDSNTKEFIIKADLLNLIDQISETKDRANIDLLGRYFEALVAYHKFYGGRES